jgi:hypothetical protein
MAAATWTSDDSTMDLLKKVVNNLAEYANTGGTQEATSDDHETTLLRKAVNNSYLAN